MTDEFSPGREIAERLRTVRFGRPLYVYPRVTSTNDLARALADDEAPEGTAVLAIEQSRGRGRLGRRWASPAGGLYLSIVLRPELPRERWPLIGLAISLGAAAAAESQAGGAVRVKWPNDLLLDGAKVGGILLEAAGDYAVCGIGVNVAPPGGGEPTAQGFAGGEPTAEEPIEESAGAKPAGQWAGAGRAAWLAARNPQVSVTSLAPDVLLQCERRYTLLHEDPAVVLTEWRDRAETLGRRVRVSGAATFAGVAEDVDEAGALLVRTADGLRRVLAGDVAHVIASPER